MSDFFFKPKRIKHLCCPPAIDKMDINSPLLIYRFPCRIKLAMMINSSVGSSNHNECYTVANQTLNAYGKWAGCPGGSGPGYSSTMRYNPGEISSGVNPRYGGSVCNCAYSSSNFAPLNIIEPVISGNPLVGFTLTTTNGTWTGFPAPTFTYQWFSGNTKLNGKTNTTYVTQAADLGQSITCRVTGTNISGFSVATSNSITIKELNVLNVTGFTLGTNYQISYVDSSNNPVFIPTITGFTIYRFFPTTTTSGTYSSSRNLSFTYLIVAGGGGGGPSYSDDILSEGNGGGGGAGGFLTGTGSINSGITYSLQVGQGGLGGVPPFGTGGSGANSLLQLVSGMLTSIGGGGGANGAGGTAGAGGSGGGGGASVNGFISNGGAGTAGQGFAGASAEDNLNMIAGSGGGASQVGGLFGGNGNSSIITGISTVYAGGGGGGANNTGSPSIGGSGGGGNGGFLTGANYTAPGPGTNGLGGGGGGGGGYITGQKPGNNGGSGVIILRFSSYF
jgi:hypothetical protein